MSKDLLEKSGSSSTPTEGASQAIGSIITENDLRVANIEEQGLINVNKVLEEINKIREELHFGAQHEFFSRRPIREPIILELDIDTDSLSNKSFSDNGLKFRDKNIVPNSELLLSGNSIEWQDTYGINTISNGFSNIRDNGFASKLIVKNKLQVVFRTPVASTIGNGQRITKTNNLKQQQNFSKSIISNRLLSDKLRIKKSVEAEFSIDKHIYNRDIINSVETNLQQLHPTMISWSFIFLSHLMSMYSNDLQLYSIPNNKMRKINVIELDRDIQKRSLQLNNLQYTNNTVWIVGGGYKTGVLFAIMNSYYITPISWINNKTNETENVIDLNIANTQGTITIITDNYKRVNDNLNKFLSTPNLFMDLDNVKDTGEFIASVIGEEVFINSVNEIILSIFLNMSIGGKNFETGIISIPHYFGLYTMTEQESEIESHICEPLINENYIPELLEKSTTIRTIINYSFSTSFNHNTSTGIAYQNSYRNEQFNQIQNEFKNLVLSATYWRNLYTYLDLDSFFGSLVLNKEDILDYVAKISLVKSNVSDLYYIKFPAPSNFNIFLHNKDNKTLKNTIGEVMAGTKPFMVSNSPSNSILSNHPASYEFLLTYASGTFNIPRDAVEIELFNHPLVGYLTTSDNSYIYHPIINDFQNINTQLILTYQGTIWYTTNKNKFESKTKFTPQLHSPQTLSTTKQPFKTDTTSLLYEEVVNVDENGLVSEQNNIYDTNQSEATDNLDEKFQERFYGDEDFNKVIEDNSKLDEIIQKIEKSSKNSKDAYNLFKIDKLKEYKEYLKTKNIITSGSNVEENQIWGDDSDLDIDFSSNQLSLNQQENISGDKEIENRIYLSDSIYFNNNYDQDNFQKELSMFMTRSEKYVGINDEPNKYKYGKRLFIQLGIPILEKRKVKEEIIKITKFTSEQNSLICLLKQSSKDEAKLFTETELEILNKLPIEVKDSILSEGFIVSKYLDTYNRLKHLNILDDIIYQIFKSELWEGFEDIKSFTKTVTSVENFNNVDLN